MIAHSGSNPGLLYPTYYAQLYKTLVRLGVRLAYTVMRGYWYIVRPVTLGVRILLVKNDAVLLVRHSYMPAWYLPGGRPKRGEALSEAARREGKEEVGAIIDEVRLCGIYTSLTDARSDHIAVFRAEAFVLENVESLEVLEQGWFQENHLPADTSVETRRILSQYYGNSQCMYEVVTG